MLRFLLVFILLFSAADAGKLEIFSKITKFVKAPSKKPRNYALRNKEHPKTGVRFNNKGYPVFVSAYTCDMKLSWFEREFDKLKNNATIRTKHYRICSRQLYGKLQKDTILKNKFTKQQQRQLRNGKTPEGYTWHHEPKTNILILVDRQIHTKTGHSGGFSHYH